MNIPFVASQTPALPLPKHMVTVHSRTGGVAVDVTVEFVSPQQWPSLFAQLSVNQQRALMARAEEHNISATAQRVGITPFTIHHWLDESNGGTYSEAFRRLWYSQLSPEHGAELARQMLRTVAPAVAAKVAHDALRDIDDLPERTQGHIVRQREMTLSRAMEQERDSGAWTVEDILVQIHRERQAPATGNP